MKLKKETEIFIKDFVSDLAENNAAIFAGAGMSREAGFVNWSELLRDIADDLGLSVDKEHDLISLAQYHVNTNKGKAKINRKILEEFAEEAESSPVHKILAKLPITTYWTTNYDTLIENALKEANKVVDVKHQPKQLANTRPKRDVVVYKMHGDVHHPGDAIITKQQYESYHKTHEHFITALSGDLISKTFLFIGFSFTDPNLDYVLSRLNIQFGSDTRQHYCFIKERKQGKNEDEEMFRYEKRKQTLMVEDLMRYKIKAILLDDYTEIPLILKEIDSRYRKKTIFISGSAEEYGNLNREEAQKFIHLLSKKIILAGFRIINGFGWGVGSAVINGALEAVYEKPERYSEDQLIMKPFPQFETGDKKLGELWEDYRQKMISFGGVAIFIFGNKRSETGEVVIANGVRREFEIAKSSGLITIPIPVTGYISERLYEEVMLSPKEHYPESIIEDMEKLGEAKNSMEDVITRIIAIVNKINKG